MNVSSFVGARTLNNCDAALQQRFRSEDITEEELSGLMEQFVAQAKKGEHKKGGWPDSAYGTSKTGLTVRAPRFVEIHFLSRRHSSFIRVFLCLQVLSMIHARRLSRERPSDGVT